MERQSVSVLILGTADWNQPIATNQHYMTRELCRDSDLNVTFVESLALRRPSFSRRDIYRIASRLRSVVRRGGAPRAAGRAVPAGLRVISPLVLPIHRGIPAMINRVLLRRRVRDWVLSEGVKVLWCYTPTTYGLHEGASASVYHCVDLLGDVPGIDSRVIENSEKTLASHGAHAVASSAVVRDSLEKRGFSDVQLWENVADTEVFFSEGQLARPRHQTRVVFAGNLSPTKVDYDLLILMAQAGLDVRVAGPRAEGGGHDTEQFEALLAAGVTYLGMLSLSDLAAELAQSTVGVVPYVMNSYTRGVSPLKTYEYLAAGVAIVATALPGVHADGSDVFTESDPADFVARVKSLATLPTQQDIDRRAAKARMHSWQGRGEQARDLVHKILKTSAAPARA